MKRKHSCKTHPNHACVACLVEMVEEGLRTNWAGSIDVTDMTHEERNRLLFGDE